MLNLYILTIWWLRLLFFQHLVLMTMTDRVVRGGECEAVGRGGGGRRQWGECHGILLMAIIY